jgi:SPX domain protein involved in polyphosphate accumulation
MERTPLAAQYAEPESRYERKFVAEQTPAASVEMIVRLHPAGFRTHHPERIVNNIYLDSHELMCFRTHVNGTPERFKLRIRWYGPEYGRIEKPVLEVKRKLGAVGMKDHYPLRPFEHAPTFSLEAVRSEIVAQVANSDIAAFLSSAEPALFNRYRRRYFLSGDQRFRLTVDAALSFKAIGPRVPGAAQRDARTDAVILELKSSVAADSDGQRIARHLPFRLGKYSKYVQGIGKIYGLEV